MSMSRNMDKHNELDTFDKDMLRVMREPLNQKRRIRKEIKRLKRHEGNRTFNLFVQGALAGLQWVLWYEDGFITPSDVVKFGVSVKRKKQKLSPQSRKDIR